MFQAYHVFKLHHVTYKGAKILLCDLSFQLLKKKARRLDTFLYIRDIIHRFNSIIYKSISFSTSFHSNFLHTSQYTPFHSISREREKILKFASYFCYSTFLQRQEKETLSFRFDEKLVIKKKRKRNRNDSRVGGDVLSKAWHLVVERQNKIKRASERKREGSKITK